MSKESNPQLILIDFYWTRDKDPRVPLGHASIRTHLEEYGIKVTPLVFAENDEETTSERVAKDLRRALNDQGDRVDIAIGAYAWAEELVQSTIANLRADGFKGRIILGGPQVSYAPAGVDALYPGADIFIRGYGEDALARLALGESPATITGVHVAGDDDRVEQTSVDLRTLKSPFLTGVINPYKQKFIRWETQRGCLYACTFCQHKEAGAKLPHRNFDWARIQAEIDLFCAAEVEQIAVLDPIFNMGDHHVAVLQRFIANGFEGELALQCRPEQMTSEFLKLVSQLNVKLEFGLQTTHHDESRAVRRINDMPKVEATLGAVVERGINHEVSLIFGLPHQTLDSFIKSVEWCIRMGVPTVKAFPLVMLRGTKLSEQSDQWNYQLTDDTLPLAYSSKTFSFEDWKNMARISQALSETEGEHPSMSQLIIHAMSTEPEITRFTPKTRGEEDAS